METWDWRPRCYGLHMWKWFDRRYKCCRSLFGTKEWRLRLGAVEGSRLERKGSWHFVIWRIGPRSGIRQQGQAAKACGSNQVVQWTRGMKLQALLCRSWGLSQKFLGVYRGCIKPRGIWLPHMKQLQITMIYVRVWCTCQEYICGANT